MTRNNIRKSNILVTGGAGFIGSHLVDRLAQDNNVIVLDNLIYGSLKNLENSRHIFIKADLVDCDLLQIMKSYDIELIFHLASYHLDDSLKEPMKDFTISALGGLRLLEACRQHRVKRLVYTSTGSVYGQPQQMGHDESHNMLPTTPYGISKATMDHYCRVYHQLFQIETVTLRYYNIYGPRRITGAIPQFIIKALRGKSIYIDGGEQTRTPTYVADAVEATYRAGCVEGIGGEIFNIAAERYISIIDLARMIVRMCKLEGKVSFKLKNYRPGEIMHLRPDVGLAKEKLGWEAEESLEGGLSKMIDFIRNEQL